MKAYNVWMEGYAATGEYAPDEYMGTYEAKSFKEACVMAMNDKFKYRSEIDKYYDKKHNTFWGCRFYEQLPDALPRYFK